MDQTWIYMSEYERLSAENDTLLAEVKLLRGANLILHDINEAKSAENAKLKAALKFVRGSARAAIAKAEGRS